MVQSYSPGCANVHPPSNTCFFRPIGVHIPNGIFIGSAVFAQLTAGSPYNLMYNGMPSLFKIAPTYRGSAPLSNTWFPGPTWIYTTNGISINSAVCARLTIVTDRLTDHATFVCNNRLHLRSTATLPNNETFKCASAQLIASQNKIIHHLHEIFISNEHEVNLTLTKHILPGPLDKQHSQVFQYQSFL